MWNPYEAKRGLYSEFDSTDWETKDFRLGIELSSVTWGEIRDTYIVLSLGFWQLSVGFRF